MSECQKRLRGEFICSGPHRKQTVGRGPVDSWGHCKGRTGGLPGGGDCAVEGMLSLSGLGTRTQLNTGGSRGQAVLPWGSPGVPALLAPCFLSTQHALGGLWEVSCVAVRALGLVAMGGGGQSPARPRRRLSTRRTSCWRACTARCWTCTATASATSRSPAWTPCRC